MSSFRHAASRITMKIGCTMGASLALLVAIYLPAAANAAEPEIQAAQTQEAVVSAPVAASAKVNAELAVCPGQTFLQPFTELKDNNYYTLVQGSESASTGEGWELQGGASVVESTRPDGSTGGVFDLPSGAVAISPPTCVTLQYPTARAWVQDSEGGGGVQVSVLYAGTSAPTHVGALKAKAGKGWQLSVPFNVQPQLTGEEEGVREVRFVYANTGRKSDYQVAGLYVDPRFTH
jgi:hypothetical protein